MLFHYVYRITNIKIKKYYYGARSCQGSPHDDLGIKYFSSSTDKTFIKDQKANQQNYKYKILRIFENRTDAISFEIKLHSKFNVGQNDSFYNKVKQTALKFDTSGIKMGAIRQYVVSEETREKIRAARKLQVCTPETRIKMSAAQKGRACTEETKKKIGLKNMNQRLTPEQKQHLSEINKGKETPSHVKEKLSLSLTQHYKEHKREYAKVCCLYCRRELSFNRVVVHQNNKLCVKCL